MKRSIALTLILICLVSVSAETLPRFLRGDKVRCLDRDSSENLGIFAGNVATDLLEANLIYWEESYKGDVVVAFMNDVYWIDFDGKSDQPWHRSLSGNAHGGTDRCITEDHYQYLVNNPTNTYSIIRANIEALKGGYGNAQRLTRLGSEYDISSCNPAKFEGVYNDIAKRWATSLQECHETPVTQHQSASDFGNFEDCYDECKEKKKSCTPCPTCTGGRGSCKDYYVAHGKLCPSKCGTQGVCCKHGSESDEGYCQESVSVDGDVFNYNMDMGTYNHHGCVPKPRNPKTCKCLVLKQDQRAKNYIESNGLVKSCSTCSEGYTLQPKGTSGECSSETKCVRCPSSSYPEIAGGNCVSCAAIEERDAPTCGIGRIYRGCSNTFIGNCRDCGVGQYTTDPTRNYCFSCNGTTLPLGPNGGPNRADECASYNATLEGCGPGPGICVCNPGHTPTNRKANINSSNPCIPCTPGTFKSTTSNEECEKCSTKSGGEMTSPVGSVSSSDCSCNGIPNEIPYRFSGSRECRQCKDFDHLRPYKPADDPVQTCRSCPDGYWFDTSLDPAQCTEIPIMKPQCMLGEGQVISHISIDPLVDQYRSPYFVFKPANGNEVPVDYYLDTSDFTIKSCRDACGEYQYSHLCGKPMDNKFYWQDLDTRVVSVLELDTESCDATTNTSKYKLKRDGVCKTCKACPGEQFNSGCDSNTEGVCQDCSRPCSSTQYSFHVKPTGCTDPFATSNYECRECEKVRKVDDKYYIVESCGNHDYHRWDPDHSDKVVEIICTAGNSGNSHSCNFDNVVRDGFLRARSDYEGSLIPYCPVGFRVESDECFFLSPNTWNKDCCVECSPDNPEKKKHHDYKRCSGKTTVDTQEWVDRCENNYYSKTGAPGDITVCTPCEMCI